MFQTTNQNLFHMFFVLLGLGTVSKPWFLDHMLQKWWSPWATDPPPARTGLYIIHHHTPNGPVEILDLPIKIVIFHNYVIYIYINYIYIISGWWFQPFWKMMEWKSVAMMTSPTDWKNDKNVPNHQSALCSQKYECSTDHHIDTVDGCEIPITSW